MAVAITMGINHVWHVILLYMSVQDLESKLITPYIQNKQVSLSFAFIIFSQLMSGIFTGASGLMLAVPLGALIVVWVQMLYVHETLGNDDVKLPGE